jgi:hypothetical protein
MRIPQFAAIALALVSGGCVISSTPLLAPDARVVPFPARIAVQAHERESATAPWKPNGEEVELVADADKIVREADATGKPDDDEYTFHKVGPNRFLTQARFGPNRYAYGLLEIQDGQGYLTAFQCKAIDPAILQRAGVKMAADDCSLDSSSDALGFLKELGARPGDPRIKYTPVKKR